MEERNIVSISTEKNVKYGFLNARELGVALRGIRHVEEVRKDHKLIELIFDDSHCVRVGDFINYSVKTKEESIRTLPYTVNHIIKEGNTYILVEEFENLSAKIALPSICSGSKWPTGEPILHHLRLNSRKDYDFYWIVNVYLSREDSPIGEYLYLKCKYHTHVDYETMEAKLISNPNFISHEDIDGYVIYKFIIPQKYQKDIKAFSKGKYSKMSPEYISKVVAFNAWEPNTVLRGALLREDWYVKKLIQDLALDFEPTELLSKPKLVEEVLV